MLGLFKQSFRSNGQLAYTDIAQVVNDSNGDLVMYHNILSIPVTNSNQPGYDFEGGLIEATTLRPLQEAQLVRYDKIVQPPSVNETELAAMLNTLPEKKGIFYFGGFLFDNFGHFLLESLSRLWALQKTAFDSTPIVFYAPWGIPNYKNKKHYTYQAFKALGIPVEQLVILTEPARLQHIAIPKQQYGFGLCRNPDKSFIDFIKSFKLPALAKSPTSELKKLYISRSQLPFNQGRPFGEQLFENYLKTQGYSIVYPEKHSLYEQLHLYKNAKKIIFCDGGAMYCNVLLPGLQADIAIIARRRDPRWNYKEITDHFLGYNKSVLWIDEVICQYQFGLETWDAAAEIDWNKVSNELVVADFCTDRFSINTIQYNDAKQHELQSYIKAIHTNPHFICYMEKLMEQHPVVPSSI